MEYYEIEKKRTMHKIVTLTTQLEEVKSEDMKYKRMWETVKARIKRGE
jgi:hypothetical protein